MEDKGLPDFNGKVIILYLSNAPHGCEDGILMEYPQFIQQNDKIFISGRVPEIEGNEWISNTQASVVWDSVIYYLEFKSIEDYRKKFSLFKPTLLDRLKNFIR